MMMKYDEHHRMEDKHSLEHNGTDLSIIMGKQLQYITCVENGKECSIIMDKINEVQNDGT